MVREEGPDANNLKRNASKRLMTRRSGAHEITEVGNGKERNANAYGVCMVKWDGGRSKSEVLKACRT